MQNEVKNRKGIIMAGGNGTRLFPATKAVGKHLLTVYDKPMIYYPLSVLMIAGIRDILIISSASDIHLYQALLGNDGHSLGLNFSYVVQEKPNGIGEAFLLAEEFLNGSPSVLILGDNIFHGMGLPRILEIAEKNQTGATVFIYPVNDPERYGVVKLDSKGNPIAIYEKPKEHHSNYAITGLYYYDHDVVNFAKNLTPSKRGELEISDINKIYLKNNKLNIQMLGRGMAWLDTGTSDSLLDASNYIAVIERRQGMKIACIEEIAWQKGWIDSSQLESLGLKYQHSVYGQYILNLVSNIKSENPSHHEVNKNEHYELSSA